MSVNKVVKIAVVLGILMAGVTFMMAALAVTDDNVDMTDTAYEDTYNITKTISIQSMSIMNVIMLIVAIAGIIIAVKFMGKV